MTERLIISGFGGQGIMLLGKIIASSALKEGKHLTWIPSYGAEVRGGAAYCMVVVSDKEIASPLVERADTLIAMNELSLERFKSYLHPKGLLIANSSLIKREIKLNAKDIVKVALTDIASRLGNIRVANVIALGVYVAKKKIISQESVLKVMEEFAPAEKKDLLRINKEAFFEGMKIR